jgi:ketosteroid isomerase-like protein
MDNHQIKSLADRFIDQLHSLEKGNLASAEALADLFADNAELTNSIIESDSKKSQRRGRQDIAQFWREYSESFQNIRSEFIDITASDHSAGLFWQSKGNDANGKPLDYEGVSLLEYNQDGKIQRFKGYFDRTRMN